MEELDDVSRMKQIKCSFEFYSQSPTDSILRRYINGLAIAVINNTANKIREHPDFINGIKNSLLCHCEVCIRAKGGILSIYCNYLGVELCKIYPLYVEDFVDLCMSYNISRNRNQLITMQIIDIVENEELKRFDLSKSSKETYNDIKFSKAHEKSKHESSPANKIEKLMPNKLIQDCLTKETSTEEGFLPIASYRDRDDAGTVVLKYGMNHSYPVCSQTVAVKIHQHWEYENWKYMMHTLSMQRNVHADIIDFVAGCIANKNNLEIENNIASIKEDYLYGRIISDCDGKLNIASIMLELSFKFGGGKIFNMDLYHGLQQVSVFPGESVVIQATILKNKIKVTNLFSNGYQAPPNNIELNEQLQVITACGPFTTKDNLTYEPLQDLLKYVLQAKPHILLLTGPFLSDEHEKVVNGSMSDAFDTYFYNLIESIMSPLFETNIQVVIVSSYKDVHHHHKIYPTPPYEMKQKFANLLFVPDPSIINIQGVLIGVTTADILFHIAKQEFIWSKEKMVGDRMSRLSQYLLQQRSFYPLYPPDRDIPIDYILFEKHAIMDTTPHILIVPSNLKNFVKKIEETTVINPERLVKEYSGGTFAKLNINFKSGLDVSCEVLTI